VRRVLALLELAEQRGFPLIAFCMGAAGRVSRVATLALGGFMTYAAADGAAGTAPGQLSVSQLRGMLRTLEGGA
jgi:3-dehydroquinate dehydratase-1/3-dehydroquinate dehydratase/shikimate dehydrogenase